MSLLEEGGKAVLLLGNEAVARGALEADISVASAYPGTPSTEIVESLASIANRIGLYVEWSTNEKVALEVAFAASLSGLRALTAMKHVGLNVAADPFFSIGYAGVKAGLVIVSADDPQCHSSQNEQDNRFYGLASGIPVYEPSTPQEMKDMTALLFNVSEKFETATLLRLTTRLCHTRGKVVLGDLRLERRLKGSFNRDPERWVLLPMNARRLKEKLLQKLAELKEFHTKFPFNRVKMDGDEDWGVIASGNAYRYAVEALQNLGIMDRVALLKLASVYPLPSTLLSRFLSSVSKVIVVEEVDPFIELNVKAIAPPDVEILGKDILPRKGELNPDIVSEGIAKIFGIKYRREVLVTIEKGIKEIENSLPKRPPVLCPGCPHRATFYEIKMALGPKTKKTIFCGDIGCYTLGYYPPYQVMDTTICMGASIGLACGLGRFTDDVIIALIGDSTFFHTGIPPLINIVYNNSPVLVIVLDNTVTAMTGHQPHPGTGFTALLQPSPKILIEKVAESLGIEHIDTFDPYRFREAVVRIRKALNYVREKRRPALLVARRDCTLYLLRKMRKQNISHEVFQVDGEKCIRCMLCVEKFACPAISTKDNNIVIDAGLCTGCGVCAQICPVEAIKPMGRGVRLDEAESF
ncbi:MAG: indolepyruvate ferredoxin oxidoreductase subunit alpha [Thermoprotei archaeon]|nr:MAG: indolepyruvate ferredoxin oxidoreductase subunit alpha [Thermoprotei archaeon]